MTISELPLAWLPLADAVAKTTVILLAAAVASLALRHASAALRHLVWTLALTSALFLPVASFALPKWQLPLFTIESPAAPALTAAIATGDPGAPSADLGPAAKDDGGAMTASAPQLGARRTGGLAEASASRVANISWQQTLLAVWLLGAAAILARILVGLLAISWLSRRTQEITDAAWLPMARAVARDMAVTPRLRFLRSGRASMPVAAGIFRPAVIMPADADGWSESRLRVVLLHELAHVRRRDCLTHVLGQAACAFHWFNPLTWLAVKRARTERERACDDLVLACGTRGSDYADQLLEMARVLRGDRFPALLGGASLAMAHRSQLEGRLIAILDPRLPRSGVTRGRAFAAVALCCAAVAPLGALQPWTARPADATTAPFAEVAALLPTPAQAPSPVSEPAAKTDATAKPDRPTNAEVDRDLDEEKSHDAKMSGDDQPHVRPEPHPDPHPSVEAVMAIGTAVATGVSGAIVDALPVAVAQDQKTAEKGGPKNDPRMVAALTAALKDSDKEVRETAMHALVQMRDPSIFEPLVQALKDASPDVREQAAFGLGQMRDRRAVQPLIGALKDENADVREKATFALGQIRDPSAVEGLAIAVRDANADVREQAVFALGQIRDRRAVEPLISALKDTAPDVREQAAFALGQIRDRAAVDALMVAVKDANADVREQVVFALGQLRDPRAIDALTTALKDQNAEVRKQAAFALGQLAR
jgi:HEAT repeat protein/beta-lactamase regulating signal transducer with metallopeptidase domain